MELSLGQKEFLLECFAGEYTIPEAFYPSVKKAIRQYANCDYQEEDLDFLLKNPQSLASVLYLNSTNSKERFARHFSLWLNLMEYHIFDQTPYLCATLLNPDPSSKQPLLQVFRTENSYHTTAAPLLYFSENTHRNATSIFSKHTAQELMHLFLSYANQKPRQVVGATDYVQSLQEALSHTQEISMSWEELRQHAQRFFTISDDYRFAYRSFGLITPSNIEWIHLLNSRPVKQAAKKAVSAAVSANPFAPELRLFHKIKNSLPAIMPKPSAAPAKFSMPKFNFPIRPQASFRPYHNTKRHPFSPAADRHFTKPSIYTEKKAAPVIKRHAKSSAYSRSISDNISPSDDTIAQEPANISLIQPDTTPTPAYPAHDESLENALPIWSEPSLHHEINLHQGQLFYPPVRNIK